MPDTGWVQAGTGSNSSVSGGTDWTDAHYITTTAGNPEYAVAQTPGQGGTTAYLHGTNYDFSVPEDAEIVGISVRIIKAMNDVGGRDHTVQLVVSGTRAGDNKADTVTDWSTSVLSPPWIEYGGSSDLWGLSIDRNTVLSSTFGAALRGTNTNSNSKTRLMRVYQMQMMVHYRLPSSGNPFFFLFSVKDRIKEILKSKPRFWLPEPAFTCLAAIPEARAGIPPIATA